MSEEIICQRCKQNLTGIKAEQLVTYEGADEHHNPPRFMFDNKSKWEGELLILCRKCHRELHDEILKIMFKYSNLFKHKKSEHWTWIAIIGENKIKCREEVYNFTKRWLNGE